MIAPKGTVLVTSVAPSTPLGPVRDEALNKYLLDESIKSILVHSPWITGKGSIHSLSENISTPFHRMQPDYHSNMACSYYPSWKHGQYSLLFAQPATYHALFLAQERKKTALVGLLIVASFSSKSPINNGLDKDTNESLKNKHIIFISGRNQVYRQDHIRKCLISKGKYQFTLLKRKLYVSVWNFCTETLFLYSENLPWNNGLALFFYLLG